MRRASRSPLSTTTQTVRPFVGHATRHTPLPLSPSARSHTSCTVVGPPPSAVAAPPARRPPARSSSAFRLRFRFSAAMGRAVCSRHAPQRHATPARRRLFLQRACKADIWYVSPPASEAARSIYHDRRARTFTMPPCPAAQL